MHTLFSFCFSFLFKAHGEKKGEEKVLLHYIEWFDFTEFLVSDF